MRFRILGPLEVLRDQGSVPLGSTKQRALLAILLLNPNQLLSRDRLIEELWAGRAPPTAGHTLEAYVHRLRKALGPDAARVLLTRPGGYLLRLEPGDLDLHVFERLVEQGRSALGAGEFERASTKLHEALALWRGRPLADIEYEPFASAYTPQLEALRLAALGDRVEAELALGRHGKLVPELEQLVRDEALHERFRGQLMLALYRCGRQADALQAYREGRALLDDQLGLEPGPELRELERLILTHDPALTPSGRAWSVGRRSRLLAGALAAIVAAAAVIVGVIATQSGGVSRAVTVLPNSVVAIDPARNEVDASVPVGTRPGPIAAGSGALWVTNLDDGTVSRIDVAIRRVVRSIPVGDGAEGLAASRDAVWSIDSSPNAEFASVRRIDPRFDSVGAPIRVRGSTLGGVSAELAATGGTVWAVTGGLGVVSRIDAATGGVTGTFDTSNRTERTLVSPVGSPTISAVGKELWVADGYTNTVTRFDRTGAIEARIPVGHGPTGIDVGLGGVWVPLSLDDRIAQIDPATNAVTRTIRVGRFPKGIVTGFGSVWVANSRDGTVSRLDPRAGRVVATIHVGGSPQKLAVVRGRVWVTVQEDVFAVGRAARGGVARVTAQSDPGSLDPALASTPLAFQLEYATCAKLVNYPDRPGPAGAKLVPEVARALPAVSADELTYTFVIRPGYRFSPPSDEAVTASTFKYSIERSLDPRMRGSAGAGRAAALVTASLDDVVGARAFETGRARHIAGITARGSTLTIRLLRPAGDLVARLATPYYCAVPLGTPIRPTGVQTVPAAGPYFVAAYSPGVRVVLQRNPLYRGPRPHPLEEIDLAIGVAPARAVSDVEHGFADYVADGIRAADARRLAVRYGAATSGRRFFVHPTPTLGFLAFNTSRSVFADARVRIAVSFAIDRAALVELGRSFGFASAVNEHYLTPGMPGFRDLRLYPPRPMLDEAKRLAGALDRSAILYTRRTSLDRAAAKIIRENLRPLGIRLVVRAFPTREFYQRVSREGEPFDLTIGGWRVDYYDPAAMLNSQIDPSSVGAPENINIARFADPVYRRRLEAAKRLSGTAREQAYAKLAIDLARDASPWVAISTAEQQDFLSARMGCVVYQPVYRLDLATLCVRSKR